MLGVLSRRGMVLYRRVDGRARFWRRIEGGPEQVLLALVAARELDQLAGGDWSEAFRLGLDPPEPVEAPGVVPGVLAENDLDSGLWKLERTRGDDGPGPARVNVDERCVFRTRDPDEILEGDSKQSG